MAWYRRHIHHLLCARRRALPVRLAVLLLLPALCLLATEERRHEWPEFYEAVGCACFCPCFLCVRPQAACKEVAKQEGGGAHV